jgi:4-amino-4-deoxy-L-arabinose transferase-like glycosyltransferase
MEPLGRSDTVRALKAIPRPLLALLGAVAVVSSFWSLFNPPGQAPDELAHVGYTQVLAEDLRLPDSSKGRTYSSEQVLAERRSNARQTAQVVEARPEWSRLVERDWDRETARLPAGERGAGGHADNVYGLNNAHANPPLYYLYESLAYRAAGGDFFDRFFAMRLWSVPLLLVATAATWLLIGELAGRRPLLQLAGAAVVGLQPMATFLSGSVSPDALLIPCFALAFWLGARILRRGLTMADGTALAAVSALAVLTKATGYALVPAAAFAIGVGAWRLAPPWRPALRVVGASAFALAIPVGAWIALARVLDRSAINQVPSASGAEQLNDVTFVNYVWQFYLPKLPFVGEVPEIDPLPVYSVWIKTGWGAFGWLEVRFPEPVYVLLALVTAGLLAGGIVALKRRGNRRNLFQAGFLGLGALTLLAGLHWNEFRVIVSEGETYNQGRYLLPLLPILGACAAGTIGLIPVRRRAPAVGVLLGGLLTLQILALGISLGRFYA